MLLPFLLALTQAAALQAPADGETMRFEYFRQRDRIEADGAIERTLEVSVHLKTPTAVRQFGQLAIPYVKDYGDVQFNAVRVRKADGSSRAVTDARLEDLNPFGINDASIPIDMRLRKLTIPGLEPGDRLSYTIVHKTKPIIPGHAFNEVKFLPLTINEPQIYELDIPASSSLNVTLRNGLGADWEVLPGDSQRLVRRLKVTVPQLVVSTTGLTEAQSRALQDPDVMITTFKSWDEVATWWWGLASSKVSGDATIKAEAQRLVAGLKTPREKAAALARFVGSTIRYLNVAFGLGRMQPREAGAVLSSRYGDCKDKVALLMSLGQAAGLDIRPVLISATRFDLVDSSPSPIQFDHVVAVAVLGPTEKDWLWLDATDALSSPLRLASPLRDKRALFVDDRGGGAMVQTPAAPGEPSQTAVTIQAALNAQGVLKGRARMESRSDGEPSCEPPSQPSLRSSAPSC